MTALAAISHVARDHVGFRAIMRAPSAATLFSRHRAVLRSRNPSKSFEYAGARRPTIPMVMNIPETSHRIIGADAAEAPQFVTAESALLVWLSAARPKDRFVYHLGHLAADRVSAAGMHREVGRLADRVMALAAEGQVLPVQMRLPDGRMAYLAIKAAGCTDRRVVR